MLPTINIEKVSKFQNALMLGNSLRELGASRVPFTYEALKSAVNGNFSVTEDDIDGDIKLDEISQEFDSIQTTDTDLEIIAYLDSIGVPENVINDFMSDKDDYSISAGVIIADSIASQFDDETILDSALEFANLNLDDYTLDTAESDFEKLAKLEVEEEKLDMKKDLAEAEAKKKAYEDGDVAKMALLDATNMPERKAGYRRKMVVRNGKKKWINERINKDKKVKLSPKQKLALAKARKKANTGMAKKKRSKSSMRRKNFGM
jgi:hypothetical protein